MDKAELSPFLSGQEINNSSECADDVNTHFLKLLSSRFSCIEINIHIKISSILKILLLSMGLESPDVFAASVNPEPAGGNVISGQASFNQQSPTVLQINQTSPKAIIQWQTFDVAKGNTVTFNTPGSSAITLNRVSGVTASDIEGAVTSNGQLWIINPNGILFGKNAQVNTAGLLASTLDISDENFNNSSDQYAFSASANALAAISNQGQITSDGGYVALLAPQINNSGVVSAQLGTVAVAAGTQATLTFTGNQLLNIAVPAGAAVPMYDNDGNPVAAFNHSGTIAANGGQVLLTSASMNTLLDESINVSGIIKADTVAEANGKIILTASGSTILNKAQISAQGFNAGDTGGQVDVLGKNIGLLGDTTINADGAAGGGRIHIGRDDQDPKAFEAKETIIDPTVVLSANATQSGNGGFIETSGDVLHEQSGHISALGANGGQAGTWLLDPYDLTISTEENHNITEQSTFEPADSTSGASVLKVDTLTGALSNSNVIVQTVSNETSGAGDITVATDVTSSSEYSLTLNAERSIDINAPVTISGTLNAIATTGDITQDLSGVITAGSTNLTASSGTIDLSQAGNSFGTLNATANSIKINDANSDGSGLILRDLNTSADNGTMTVRSVGGLRLDGASLNAGTGTVNLTGLSIDDNHQNNETISAGTTTLLTAGYIQLDGNNYFGTLSAAAGGSENGTAIDVADINPIGLTLGTILSTSGQPPGPGPEQTANIIIEAKKGDLKLVNDTSVVASGIGNISLTSNAGDITVNNGATISNADATAGISLGAYKNIEENGSITSAGGNVTLSAADNGGSGTVTQGSTGSITAGSGSTWGNVTIFGNKTLVLDGSVEGEKLFVQGNGSAGVTQNSGSLISHYSLSQNGKYGVEIDTGGDEGSLGVIQVGSIQTYGSDVFFNVLHHGVTQSSEGSPYTGSIDTTGQTSGAVNFSTNGDAVNLQGDNRLGTLQIINYAGAIHINDVSTTGLILGEDGSSAHAIQSNSDLTIKAAGPVTQVTPVEIYGATSINAGTSDITLSNAANDFSNNAVSLSGFKVSVTDNNGYGLVVGAISATDLTINAQYITDGIDHSGSVDAANTNLIATGDRNNNYIGGISLKNTSNNFGTLTATSAANLETAIDLVNGLSDLTVASLSTTLGDPGGAGISLISGGSIIIRGPIVADSNAAGYTGALTLTSHNGSITEGDSGSISAGSDDFTAATGIDLESAKNQFTQNGSLSAINTTSGNITLVDGNANGLVLGNVTASANVTLAATQLSNTLGSITTGKDNSWNIYLTNLDGNTFGNLASVNQAIWGTAYKAHSRLLATGNRYIFGTSETLNITPVVDGYNVNGTAGTATTFDSALEDTNYLASGWVDSTKYGNVFTQDTAANTSDGMLYFSSAGASRSAIAGAYPIIMNASANPKTTGYALNIVEPDSYGTLTLAPAPPSNTVIPMQAAYVLTNPTVESQGFSELLSEFGNIGQLPQLITQASIDTYGAGVNSNLTIIAK